MKKYFISTLILAVIALVIIIIAGCGQKAPGSDVIQPTVLAGDDQGGEEEQDTGVQDGGGPMIPLADDTPVPVQDGGVPGQADPSSDPEFDTSSVTGEIQDQDFEEVDVDLGTLI